MSNNLTALSTIYISNFIWNQNKKGNIISFIFHRVGGDKREKDWLLYWLLFSILLKTLFGTALTILYVSVEGFSDCFNEKVKIWHSYQFFSVSFLLSLEFHFFQRDARTFQYFKEQNSTEVFKAPTWFLKPETVSSVDELVLWWISGSISPSHGMPTVHNARNSKCYS